MFHVKYRDSMGRLRVCEGRSEFEDAESEAEDYASAKNTEVEVLVDTETADANMEAAAALSRGHSLLRAVGYGCRDDGRDETEEVEALR